MTSKITKLSKKEFFANLAYYCNFKGIIKLMHGQHLIATLEVNQAKQGTNLHKRFDVTVSYAGNTLKKLQASSFKKDAGVEYITSIFGWSSLSYHEELIFDWRTIEVVETVEEVKPVATTKTGIIIDMGQAKSKTVEYRDVGQGQAFFHDNMLYINGDEDDQALEVESGILVQFDGDDMVLPTTLTVVVTGDRP